MFNNVSHDSKHKNNMQNEIMGQDQNQNNRLHIRYMKVSINTFTNTTEKNVHVFLKLLNN